MQGNCMVIIILIIKSFKVNLDQLHDFFNFKQYFVLFFRCNLVQQLFKLDPDLDPH